MRKPGDQIDVDLIHAGRTDACKLRLALLLRVKPANGRGFSVHKRLHTETDTVHPLLQEFVKRFVGELTRCAFERNLSIVGQVELSTQMVEYLPELPRRQQTRGSTAKVNRVHISRQGGSRQNGRNILRSSSRCPDLPTEAVYILLHPFRAEDSRGEVAEGALCLAERNRDVDANRSSHSNDMPSLQLFHARIVHRV